MKRPPLKKAVLVVLSVGLAVYLLGRINPLDVLRVLSGFPPVYFLGGFMLFLGGHYTRSLRMRLLLGPHAPASGLFRIIALQTAAVGFLPFRAGEFSLLYLLKSEHGVDYAESTAALMLAKAFDFLVVVTMFVVSAGTLESVPEYYGRLLPWAGGLFFIVAVALLVMGRADSIYARLPGMFRQGRIMRGLEKVAGSVSVIRSKSLLVGTFGVSLVLWCMLYGSSFLIIRGVGLSLTVPEMVFLTTSMTLFMNLPVHAPGSVGTAEALWVAVVRQMDVTIEQAVATGFASHIVTIVYTLIFMLYGLSLLRSKTTGEQAE